MSGRNITVAWDVDSGYISDQTPKEHIKEFIIEHDLGVEETPLVVPATVQEYVFKGVLEGTYFVSITIVDKFDKRSIPITREIEVVNDFSVEIPRLPGNLPVGGSVDSNLVVDNDKRVRFEKPSYTLNPVHPASKIELNTNLTDTAWSQSAGNLTAVSNDNLIISSGDDFDTVLEVFSFLLYQPKETVDKLKLIKWQKSIPSGFGYTIERWYNQGSGSGTEESDYVDITGRVTRLPESSQLNGIGTSFTTEVKVGDIIKADEKRHLAFKTTAPFIDTVAKTIRMVSGTSLGVMPKVMRVTYDKNPSRSPSGDNLKSDTFGGLTQGDAYFLERLSFSNNSTSALFAVHATQAHAEAGSTSTRITLASNTDGFDQRFFHTDPILTPQGVVTFIESDTKLFLDNYKNIDSVNTSDVKRSGLRPNLIADTVIAGVVKKQDGSIFINRLTEKVATDQTDLPPASTETSVPGKFVHYFPTNSVINGKLTDTVGNAKGVIEGTNFAISDDSIMGNSLSLSGSTGVRLLQDSQADTWMNTTSSWSVAFWAKSEKNDSTNTVEIDDARLISRDRSEFFAIQMDQGASQEVRLDYRNGSSVVSKSVISHSSKDEWHHYAVTYDKTTLKVYVDGIFKTSVTDYAPNYSQSRPLGLGANVEDTVQEDSPVSGSFVGKFTEIRLYTKALSEGEILGLYTLPGASNDTAIKDNTTVLGEGDQSLHIDEQGVYLGSDTVGTAPFSVTPEGAIKATSGKIADWNLSSSALFSGVTATTTGFSASGITLAAQGSLHAPEFYIDNTGSAFFKGEITASSGHIGGWQIRADGMHSANLSFNPGDNMPASGYLPSASGMVIHNQGSIHTHNFFVNSDGTAEFRGDISGATGTFSGAIGDQSIGADQIADGSIGSAELAPEAITGFNISPSGTIAVFSKSSNGAVIPSSFAALDGADDLYRIYAGSNAAGNAPFRVTKTGKVIADNIQLFGQGNNIFFDSNTGGFTDAAVTQIAQKTATRVNSFSELFTGAKDSSDTSTFEEITLTETTDLVTNLAVPVSNISKTVSKPYFGNRSNALFITIDFQSLAASGTASFNRVSHIKKPGGAASSSSFKVGEILRVNLVNVPAGCALTNVTGAKNAFTGNDYGLPTNIQGPSSVNFLLFEIDSSSEEFTFTVSSSTTANISFVASGSGSTEISQAKPTTETEARAGIPDSIAFGLNYSTVSAEHATVVAAQATKTFTKYTGSGTPSATQYKVATLSKDVVDADTIHSTVAVISGGAVDDQGYITHSSTTTSLTASSYFFHSTLTVSGGDTDLQPTTRLFTASVGSGTTGFIIQPSGAATQTSQAGAFGNMVLNGDMTVGSSFSIDPDNTSGGQPGTVTIEGNLHVTGTQTSVNQTNLEITDKTLLLAANATTAAAVNGAGIVVDRSGFQSGAQPNATFLWDQNNTEWDAYTRLTANSFRSAVDGSVDNPAYRFGTRTKTGIFASDTSGNDAKINIVTRDNSDNAHTAYFTSSGLHSNANLYTGDTGQFRNYAGVWKATTGTGDNGFEFIPNNASSAVVKIQPSGTSAEALIVSSSAENMVLFESTETNTAKQVGITLRAPHEATYYVENQENGRYSGGMQFSSGSNSQEYPGLVLGVATACSGAGARAVSRRLTIPSTALNIGNIPSVVIDRNQFANTGETGGPIASEAALILANPNTTLTGAAASDGKATRYKFNSINFVSALSSINVANQAKITRAYISGGEHESGEGYGYIELGVQRVSKPNDDDYLTDTTRPSPSLHINRHSKVGINTINPLYNFHLLDAGGSDATMALQRIDSSAVGSKTGNIDFVSDPSGATNNSYTRIESTRRPSNWSRLSFKFGDHGGMGSVNRRHFMSIDADKQQVIVTSDETLSKSPADTILAVERYGVDTFKDAQTFSAGVAIDTTAAIYSFNPLNIGTAEFTIKSATVGVQQVSKIMVLAPNLNPVATEYAILAMDVSGNIVDRDTQYDVTKSSDGLCYLLATNLTGGSRNFTGKVELLRTDGTS